MLPSQFPEFKVYPAVHKFVRDHLDMQFNDVRGMMKLPLIEIGITGGCNFAAAAVLCNLVSGMSKVLYTPRKSKIGSGKRFKELLEKFYPWEPNENKAEKSKVIYDLVRNPLAHSLGVLSRHSLPVTIQKSPLKEHQLKEIEESSMRPTWVPLAVRGDSTQYVISVLGLYWGVFHLLQRLAKHTQQMQEAEKRIVSEKIQDCNL